MTTTIDLRPHKGTTYAVYVDGKPILIGTLKRCLAVCKVLRHQQ